MGRKNLDHPSFGNKKSQPRQADSYPPDASPSAGQPKPPTSTKSSHLKLVK